MNRLSNGYTAALPQAVAIACCVLLGAGALRAHVTIANVTVAPRDAKTATVRFDISWENSWRHEANHDAAWVFFKVRAEGGTDWEHVRLVADKVLNPTGYGQAEGTPLDFIVPDGEDGFSGMMVRRAEYSARGPLAARDVTALYDLTSGKGIAEDTKASVQAFGIEMVYVAEGSFYLGSGGIENGGFYRYTDGSQCTLPYLVTSAGAIPTGQQDGKLWARKGALPEDGGEIPATFPNGYAASYCMKYRITRAEYARFLDLLTDEQAEARHPGGPVKRVDGNREYNLGGSGYGLQFELRGVSWADGAFFAAWAGLRPMTELECVKVCRGSRQPVPDEHCASYWEVGSFAGSLWHSHLTTQGERTVTVANSKGRAFRGTHGDGTLNLPPDWPQVDAVGAGMRCGRRIEDGFAHMAPYRLADRQYAAEVIPQRTSEGCRGVRTAPKE